jgi:hypothetical protein
MKYHKTHKTHKTNTTQGKLEIEEKCAVDSKKA